MGFFNGKKLFALGVIFVLLAAIPLAVYFLQKEQETRSRAAKSTVLSLLPVSNNKTVGDKFTLDVMIDPGTNVVTNINLAIIYDQEKISTQTAEAGCDTSFCPTGIIPINNLQYEPGKISVSLMSTPGAPSSIQTKTKIATITFQANAATTTPVQIGFGNETNVQATIESAPELNVLSTTNPATVNITGGVDLTLTPSPITTVTPTINTTLTPNQPPICTSLNVDRVTSGTAPFSITFTANGNDPDGTIGKITFDFGDGPVQDITQAGGIGTNTISAQTAHTYNNPGTYKASVILTDNSLSTSNPATCTQTITVESSSGSTGGSSGGSTGAGTPSADQTTVTSPPVTSAPIVQTSITPPGPGDKIITIGIAGAVLSILGALLFFAL